MIEVANNLRKHHFEVYYADKKEDVYPLLCSLIDKTGLISHGGSMTLEELGILTKLEEDGYNVNNRSKASDKRKSMLAAFDSKYYLCSANAISKSGEIVNIDGTGNRVAAITYGPENVIMIVGRNKICDNILDALARARLEAAPKNAIRLLGSTEDSAYEDSDKLCVSYVIHDKCRPDGRIKVILVNENLGY